MTAKASGSFLKKRTKKLLIPLGLVCSEALAQSKKSFLLLFFKKEALPFLPAE
jgi:hypothetical protein